MQLLTKKEVANKFRMSVEWVGKAASSGKIPSPVYLDGHKRWREKDIDEWIS
jgi:predicted DNA-binding transcriptional regulator AlpA